MSGINLNALTKTKEDKKIKKSSGGSIMSFLEKDISFSGGKIGDRSKEKFYSELNILLAAGVDIKTALELIIDQLTKKKEKEIFVNIQERVLAGDALSFALQQSGKFSGYEYYSLQIGEESGKMLEVLKDLSAFYARKIKQRRQLTGALSYPAVVMCTAFGAIFFMLKFVVPMFAEVFKRFNSDLPAITKFIIRVADFFSKYFFTGFILLLLVIFLLWLQKDKSWFRQYSSAFVLKIPVVGELLRKIYLARFCHSMNLLIGAKTSLVTALDLVSKMVGFYPIEISLIKVKDAILHGDTLHNSMTNYAIYPKRMTSLIKVAEEVNQLEQIFNKLYQQYTDEADHQTSVLSSVMEPLIIIFLGVLVGFILVAMYLPLFKLSTSFH